ncbi:hypothetical protein FDP41_007456 [Naegleria fowleri]|uniref:SHOCT domain-containing protein n=1 Tax=Naegleria fowleri TaxID=5763 RepID=A0A6A5CG58_NAEFO|nr:uncharacterized protein FDP41_007456 [Naegleria fowleri]KAF0984279.1 hypothetical protein FDP41_007456 [Naegleria fowleri]
MVTLTDEQREQIQILESFLEQGLMDPEDFEEEKKKILSGGSIADEDEEDSPLVVSGGASSSSSNKPFDHSQQPSSQSKPTSSTSVNTTSTTTNTSTQRKHVIHSSSDDDEPVIKSTQVKRNVVKTSTVPSSSTTTKPNITTSVSKTRTNPSSRDSAVDYAESGDDAVVSDDNNHYSSDDRDSFMKHLGGVTGRKILQNSTEDEESDDQQQSILLSKNRNNGMSTNSVKKNAQSSQNSKNGYQLKLTSQERELLTAEQIQQLEKMAHLVDTEILSEDELLTKKDHLLRQQQRKIEEEERKSKQEKSKTTSTTAKKSPRVNLSVEDQLKKLEDLFDAGILTEEEYRAKRRQLLPEESSDENDEEDEDDEEDDDEDDGKGLKLKLTPLQRDQLSKLDSLLEMGILDHDEYEEKKRQVMGLKNEKTPSKIITKKQEANKEFGDVIEMVVFITNIRATPEKPFKLIYEGDQIMYQREEDSGAGKTIIVRGEVPKKPKEDTIVTLCVDMPQINIHTQQNFNLSEHGRFIQIQITQEGNRNNIRIKQQHDDSFDTEQQLGDKNDEMSRIYVHYSAIPASEEKPFKLWIGDMLAHQLTEPMTKSQSGVLRGAIPKIKRCNPSTESHHDVKLKVHIPMIDPEEKVYIVNLTDNGDHVGIFLDGSKITLRQEKDKVDSDSPILEPVKSSKK